MPPALEEQLAEGGRLIAPVAARAATSTSSSCAAAPDGLERTPLNAVRFVPLR